MDDTIITDVETREANEAQEGLTQRELSMQRLLDSRRGSVETAEPAKVVTEEVTDDTIILKVDGQEVRASRDKVLDAGVRAMQKDSTADKRLAEAAAREARITAREQELAAMERELIAKRDRTEDVEPDETGRAFADALFTDENVVAKTITSITKRLNEVAGKMERVERAESEKETADFQRAVSYYHQKYNDIASDPDRHLVMNKALARVAGENPTMSRAEIIDTAAAYVIERFPVQREESQEPPPSSTATRQQAKEKMPAPLKSASARTPAAPPVIPKTTGQVIGAMRKNRGPRAY